MPEVICGNLPHSFHELQAVWGGSKHMIFACNSRLHKGTQDSWNYTHPVLKKSIKMLSWTPTAFQLLTAS